MACRSTPPPITDDERVVIWRWAKENAIDKGLPLEKVSEEINNYFFGGLAKPEWINDILTGRKTPYKHLADDAWKKQYNRRVIIAQAKELSRLQSLGPTGKFLRGLWTFPRGVATFGHGVVFPISHGGDLMYRPESWATFFKGAFNTWRGTFSKATAARLMANMQAQPLFDTALRSGLDVGPKSHPTGILNRIAGGSAARGWDMLTVMRYDLWQSQMEKFLKPGMEPEEVLDIGKNLATWANHATGSGKGPVANLGGVLFGPKLTQSKLNRLFSDPATTIKTFTNWDSASPGEKAVAWTRLKGATQYLVTNLGFLAVNAGLQSLLSKKPEDQVNFTNPMKADFLDFKLGGLQAYVPGMHTEVRTLAKVLAAAFMTRKETRGYSRQTEVGTIIGQYSMAKLTPAASHGLTLLMGQDYRGRPVPWSSDPGTKNAPRMSWGEYIGEIGPIPLEGPIGYVYDQIKKAGASATDATTIVKGLIITGLGVTGVQVREVQPSAEKTRSRKAETVP